MADDSDAFMNEVIIPKILDSTVMDSVTDMFREITDICTDICRENKAVNDVAHVDIALHIIGMEFIVLIKLILIRIYKYKGDPDKFEIPSFVKFNKAFDNAMGEFIEESNLGSINKSKQSNQAE